MWKSPLFLRATWSKNFRVWQKKLFCPRPKFSFSKTRHKGEKSMVFHKQSRHFFFVKRRRLFLLNICYPLLTPQFVHATFFLRRTVGSWKQIGFPISYLPVLLPWGWGKWGIHRDFGDQKFFPQESSGFWGKYIFMILRVWKTKKKCKILKWRLNWIKEFVKLIQWKDSLDYFFNFITEYYWVKHSKFSLNNWSILLLISIILLLRDLEERLMRMKTIFWSLGFEELKNCPSKVANRVFRPRVFMHSAVWNSFLSFRFLLLWSKSFDIKVEMIKAQGKVKQRSDFKALWYVH